MAEYAYASPDVAEIAHKVIAEHHSYLLNRQIIYMMVDDMKTRNKTVLGKIKKVSSLEAALLREEGVSDYELMVIINEASWLRMTDEQKVALLDHEFCHVEMDYDKDGQEVLKIARP